MTYTFHLRRGVLFQDGAPFDAEAVKFNWDRMLDPKIGYAAQQYQTLIKSVRVIDKYTVEVVTPKPNADFIQSLLTDDEVRLHSPTAIQKWGRDYGSKAAVGTGPFMFQEWVPSQRIVIVKKPALLETRIAVGGSDCLPADARRVPSDGEPTLCLSPI